MEKLAQHDTSVLMHGERGTGKESIARWLHISRNWSTYGRI